MDKRLLTSFICASLALSAQSIVKVDLDMTGRNSSEVTETGYTAWVANVSNTLTIDGATFKLENTNTSGSLSATWYKAGIQSPYYAKLVCDGAYIKDGDKNSGLKLTISELSDGEHSILTYHNAVDDYSSSTLCDMDIYLNGTKIQTITPSKRALTLEETKTFYLTFTGTGATIEFKPSQSKNVDSYKVYLNGFALDVPNSANQASSPYPTDNDEHAIADGGSITLSWKSANGISEHRLFIGNDSTEVANATTPTKVLNNTSYTMNDLSNLESYYWRVDEVDANGNATKGDVWYFKPRHLAFRGADGYGKYAIGGRGGKVVYVTNLNDSGEGSLREAITNDIGPRTIVFAVSGLIKLQSRLSLSSSKVTIAGQTAPGRGITICGAPLGVMGDDCTVRFIRSRRGYASTTEEQNRGLDGLGITGATNTIVDHASISWTTDEAFSSRGAKSITLQRTLISEALNIAGHPNYPAGTGHGYAATIGGSIGSFHHNLLAHNQGRNWSMGGGLDGNGYYAGELDIFNNVVYNWWHRVCDGGAHEVNFVGNYYKRGAASEQSNMDYMLSADLEGVGKGSQAYYYHNNIMAHQDGTMIYDGTDDTKGKRYTLSNGQNLDWQVWNSKPFFESLANVESARNAYKSVLSDVGCNMPLQDNHDQRMVSETLSGTYSCIGSKSKVGGMIDNNSESKEGDYSYYTTEYRPADYDTDLDGLPDWWEKLFGLNPNSAKGDFSDANADDDGDGYTNLEEYLEWMATPHFEAGLNEAVTIPLDNFFKGFVGNKKYTIAEAEDEVSTSINGSSLEAKSAKKGIYYICVKVVDSEGDTFARYFAFKADGEAGPAEIIKQGAGSSRQTVCKDSAIVNFSYRWENAEGVTVSGLPNGIETEVKGNVVYISGVANDEAGRYDYSVETYGGNPDSIRGGYIIIEECAATAIANIATERIAIEPNPISDILTIRNITIGAEISIFTAEGVLIFSKKAEQNNEAIDVSHLQAGNYIIKIGNATARTIIVVR